MGKVIDLIKYRKKKEKEHRKMLIKRIIDRQMHLVTGKDKEDKDDE